jgi:hypothetical protein
VQGQQEKRGRKLLEAPLEGYLNLLKEMKRVRAGKYKLDELQENVAGAEDDKGIANKFLEAKEALYNSADTKEEMEKMEIRIKQLIRADSMEEVKRITGEAVKVAAYKLKPRKAYDSGGFTSDCLLHGPDILFQQLAAVSRGWVVHGTVTPSVLACTFMPLLKPKKPLDETTSYQAIAGSSLILKLF